MTITISFDEDYVEYMKEKFEIRNEDDLRDAVLECVDTYMEL